MFRPRILPATERRRAVILMVVLVLLTLFAIVGLAFVLYANAEGEASRVYRETTIGINRIDISTDSLGGYALGQFLYDGVDPLMAAPPGPGNFPAGYWSAMRGQSVGRDLYGWNQGSPNPGSNIYPFNGVGHLHTAAGTFGNPYGIDDHLLPNYVPFVGDPFVRDPEHLGSRADLTKPLTPFAGGWNSSYTYPDGNHVFLAAVDANGYVLVPSFHRPWMFGPLGNSLTAPDTVNPNWTNAQGKYMTMRPRPIDQLVPGLPSDAAFPPARPYFGYPGDATGDVKNLQGYPGGNDSVWLDLDYPVQTAADGTKFKPLFAFLIADLDGRINLNTHGNVRGAGNAHLSNQGWGKTEVNPTQLSAGGPGTGEWPQMFVGAPVGAPRYIGRYGPDGVPTNPGGVAPSGRAPHVYGPVDYDASNEGPGGAPTGKYTLPAGGANFPTFPPGYGNGSVASNERKLHPLLYDSQYPSVPGSDDRRFGAGNLVALLNGGISSPTALTCPLGQLLPTNLAANPAGFRIRNMITTESAGFDRPGLSPWLFDRSGAVSPNAYGYPAAGAGARFPPTGAPVNFPALGLRGGPVPASSEFRNPGLAAGAAAIDWRAVDVTLDAPTLSSALAKVDLNRFLSPYPHQGHGTTLAGSVPPGPVPGCTPTTPFTIDAPGGPIYKQSQQALLDRQNLANDIYRRLLLVTGVPPVGAAGGGGTPAAPMPIDLAPRRWLAQLAANIVDFLDEDEISTAFNFYTPAQDGLAPASISATTSLGTTPTGTPLEPSPTYWVFGTELPKVLINEVLAEYTPPAVPAPGMTFPVRVFVELYNPIPVPPAGSGTDPMDSTAVPLYIPAAGPVAAYSPYQLLIADNNINPAAGVPNFPGLVVSPTPSPNNNDAVLGTPNVVRSIADFSTPPTIVGTGAAALPQIGGPVSAPVTNPQFFLVGPTATDAHGTIAVAPAPGVVPPGTPMMTTPAMAYTVTIGAAPGLNWTLPALPPALRTIADQTQHVNVLLRRLVNPHQPYDGTVATGGVLNPNYNPYVTVDYLGGGVPNPGAPPPALARAVPLNNTTTSYASASKLQPYAAHPTQVSYLPVPATPTTTNATFGSLNVGPTAPPTATGVYDWLVHMDRQLINPMELLHVSGFQPYDLTRQFVSPPPGGGARVKFNHRIDWYNEQNRLYRIFEFLGTADRAAFVSSGGRLPGLVNLNTIYDQETLQAVCDAQPANGFTPAQVTAIFNQMLALRSPKLLPPVPGSRFISGQDRPFLGMGIANTLPSDPTMGVRDDGTPKLTNTGIEDTFLRSFGGTAPTGVLSTEPQRLFGVPDPGAPAPPLHPYQTSELMTKIYNNVTTRSNVFAVWITVGFFEVVKDPATGKYVGDLYRPVKIGPEIGAATGTNIRHRMFAVVDRTKMMIGTTATVTKSASPVGPAPAVIKQPSWVQVMGTPGVVPTTGAPNISGVANPKAPVPIPWSIQQGSALVFDNGNQFEETAIVLGVSATTPPGYPPGPPGTSWVQAQFQKPHGAGAGINIPGNPGPQPTFSIAATAVAPGFSGLVLGYTVLE